MAEKDTTEKILEAYNDVFSDIVNVLLFHGEEVLKPEELEDQAPRSYYKADGKIHKQMARSMRSRGMLPSAGRKNRSVWLVSAWKIKRVRTRICRFE